MILKKLFIATAAISAVMATTSFGELITTTTTVPAEPTHTTTKWQSIGWETIKTAGSSDNGVFYSLDKGTTWANLTDLTEFTVGQSVDFRVDIYKEFQGTHYSDVAKVWIDGAEKARGEWLLADNGNIVSKNEVNYHYYDGNVASTTLSQATGNPEFLGSIAFNYTFNEARTYELVARAMCSDDLGKLDPSNGKAVGISYVEDEWAWNNYGVVKSKTIYQPSTADWNAFTATNPLSTLQGEIEKYTFNVKNVPEPTMLSLFGFGILSFAFFRRKK